MLALAQAEGKEGELGSELSEFVRLLDAHPDLETFLTSPLVDVESRRQTLEKLLAGNASPLLCDALQVVNRKGRMELMRVISEAYRQELDQHAGRVGVQVTTAVPLTGKLRTELERATSKLTGKQASLEEFVDESLIGGMVLQVGDRKIDNSVAREISKLGERLTQRASREILSGKSYVQHDKASPREGVR